MSDIKNSTKSALGSMVGLDISLARLVVLGLATATLVACSQMQTPAKPNGDPVAQTKNPGAGGVPYAPLWDHGIGAVPQAGVHRGGPMGTLAYYDHIAEESTARGYGQSTPFGPPGTPAAYPNFPTPYPD